MLPFRFKTKVSVESSRALKAVSRRQPKSRQYSSQSAKPIFRSALVAGGASLVLLGGLLTQEAQNDRIKAASASPEAYRYRRTVFDASDSSKKSKQKSPSPTDQQDEEVTVTKELYAQHEALCFVIGTGIDASHDEFDQGQVLELSDPVDGSTPTLQQSTFHIPEGISEQGQNCWAHETKVASVIGGKYCGISPGQKLVDVRIAYFNRKTNECTYEDDKLERSFKNIKTFLEANPDTKAVINLSMGAGWSHNIGQRSPCKCREEWQYPTQIIRNIRVDKVIQDLYYLGVLTVAAAGNDCSPAYTTWPSSNPYVLAIGAVDRNGVESQYSNFGAAVALFARGVDVRVAYMAPDEYDTASGTSYAAPYVAGFACNILTDPFGAPGLQTRELRPGALKSLLFDRFDVVQRAKGQPERYRKRSDGQDVDDKDESAEDEPDGDDRDQDGKDTEGQDDGQDREGSESIKAKKVEEADAGEGKDRGETGKER